jgi:hypothetical protein
MMDELAPELLKCTHEDLSAAFPFWVNGDFPDAKNVGDVVRSLREIELLKFDVVPLIGRRVESMLAEEPTIGSLAQESSVASLIVATSAQRAVVQELKKLRDTHR